MVAGPYALDSSWVRRSFDRAGTTYDAASVLQAEVREILLERLDLTRLEPRLVLDAGAGTGHASRALKRRYPGACVIALDFSLGMLRAAANRQSLFRRFFRVCADAARLPLGEGCVDLILSNLLLPWIDPEPLFAEFRRVLAPRGFLTFSSLGPDTLSELREAWALADSHARVHPFIDMHELGDALVRAGFAGPVLDMERYTLHYEAVDRLAADLKASGERNAAAGRLKGLTGPRKWKAMSDAYEIHRRNGRLPATFEVVFGQAWAPALPRPRAAAAGSATPLSLEEMRRQIKTPRRR
ncbi:MAG TPA: malonyl-ACP O-methyltransferase BioC [Steroidobacteraceae bacterium]|nr:malonyl-ACP O-methyltransferase BioC [Steroidobacteraceae bacterium]